MTVSDIIAIVAAAVAVVSVVVAMLALRRSSDAHRLQERIDAREREFRHVTWRARWRDDLSADESVVLRLENTGLTDAHQVTVVLFMRDGEQSFALGNVAAGADVNVRPRTDLVGPVAAATLALAGHGIDYGVHWSSPLGQVDRFTSRTPTAPHKPQIIFD